MMRILKWQTKSIAKLFNLTFYTGKYLENVLGFYVQKQKLNKFFERF